MIKVAVMGVAGRMGGRILTLMHAEKRVMVVGATESVGHSSIGQDAGDVVGLGKIEVMVTDKVEQAAKSADVVVDFTAPSATVAHAEYASENGKSMVIGTTGLSEYEQGRLKELARKFPCVQAPNMSVGVNVMLEAAKRMAVLLGDEFEVEIMEAHHRHKVDSPSGTALRLGKEIAEALDRDFDRVAKFNRHGRIGERDKKEIGIQTIRGGDIVGEHTLMFCGSGERLELIHRATSRDSFVRGTIRAVKWIVGKPPGIYSMKDVLGI